MPTDSWSGARYPDADGSSSLWVHYENLAKDLAGLVVPRFASTSARDAAATSRSTEGYALTAGQLAEVTGAGRYRYNGSTWQPDRGIIGTSVATSQWNGASGGAEQRITTLGITSLSLRSGNAYKARLKCRAWPGVNGVTFSLRVRASSTGTPTATSDAVAARQIALAPGPDTAASDYVVEDDFVVQTSGSFNISAFGIVASGTMAVGNDGRGRYELLVYDLGPAPSGMNTVTT